MELILGVDVAFPAASTLLEFDASDPEPGWGRRDIGCTPSSSAAGVVLLTAEVSIVMVGLRSELRVSEWKWRLALVADGKGAKGERDRDNLRTLAARLIGPGGWLIRSRHGCRKWLD